MIFYIKITTLKYRVSEHLKSLSVNLFEVNRHFIPELIVEINRLGYLDTTITEQRLYPQLLNQQAESLDIKKHSDFNFGMLTLKRIFVDFLSDNYPRVCPFSLLDSLHVC